MIVPIGLKDGVKRREEIASLPFSPKRKIL